MKKYENFINTSEVESRKLNDVSFFPSLNIFILFAHAYYLYYFAYQVYKISILCLRPIIGQNLSQSAKLLPSYFFPNHSTSNG